MGGYLPKLEYNAALSESCRDHLKEQGVLGITGHHSLDKSTPYDRVLKYGDSSYVGENLAYGRTPLGPEGGDIMLQ